MVNRLIRRGAGEREVSQAREILDPGILTIGFARRFATYKRGDLLLHDIERLKRILNSTDKPVQFVFAGKAHPRDDAGKELIRRIVHFARGEDVRRRIVFLDDYDMAMARYLVQGVDVWLNNPRRPMEASGTSGMKVIPNGGLNFSVLDGWWVEGYDPSVGWEIGRGEDYTDYGYQDYVESQDIYETLEREIVPLYYDRGADNLPHGWIAKMKASMKALGPVFTTARMVAEYAETYYVPAARRAHLLAEGDFSRARALIVWKQRVRESWGDVHVVSVSTESDKLATGQTVGVTAIDPAGREDQARRCRRSAVLRTGGRRPKLCSSINAVSIVSARSRPTSPEPTSTPARCHPQRSGQQGFTIRVLAVQPGRRLAAGAAADHLGVVAMPVVSGRTRERPLPRMGRVQRKRWTRSEYHRLLDVGVLDEGAPFALIEGEIIAKLTVNQPHVIACRRTTRLPEGVFGAEFVQAQAPIALNERTEPEPDIYVLNRPVEEFVGDPPGAETVLLIVEVSDTSLRRDLGFKAAIYARAGIAEY